VHASCAVRPLIIAVLFLGLLAVSTPGHAQPVPTSGAQWAGTSDGETSETGGAKRAGEERGKCPIPCEPEGEWAAPPTAEEINDKLFAIGGGLGVSTTIFVAASLTFKWVSLDVAVGTLFNIGLNTHYGVTGRVPFVNESLAALLYVSAGRDWGGTSCLGLEGHYCVPPEVENTVEAALGAGYRWPDFELRALLGAKYRWGKRENEWRAPIDSPYTPVVRVVALFRVW